MTSDDDAPTQSTPGLWRLKTVAARLGLHPETLAAAAEAREVPLTLIRIGPRGIRFFKASEVDAFMRNEGANK
ncbi:helix-turn-helix transcriptional regulator [Thauera humireducens]|uniref:Helix-turn-helix domain-containing protein n=1 Tax=Thauera humireducens TaxID=1134435 RepID=A0A127K2P4_9RHOO|nr:hypothetical protein [Thauera humireducens]AMO36230.1 hypothetical protein AC731_004345 [Thauera humireducens]